MQLLAYSQLGEDFEQIAKDYTAVKVSYSKNACNIMPPARGVTAEDRSAETEGYGMMPSRFCRLQQCTYLQAFKYI
jgi:hypothetical protein